MPDQQLRDAISGLAKIYRSRQEVHARKAGYQGMHAEREYVYDMVAVDLERVLAGEEYLTENEHGRRRIYDSVSKGATR